jgi:hypothetical protein
MELIRAQRLWDERLHEFMLTGALCMISRLRPSNSTIFSHRLNPFHKTLVSTAPSNLYADLVICKSSTPAANAK